MSASTRTLQQPVRIGPMVGVALALAAFILVGALAIALSSTGAKGETLPPFPLDANGVPISDRSWADDTGTKDLEIYLPGMNGTVPANQAEQPGTDVIELRGLNGTAPVNEVETPRTGNNGRRMQAR